MRNGSELHLDRCPHCSIAKPRLERVWRTQSFDCDRGDPRIWTVYLCGSCGGAILTAVQTIEIGQNRIQSIEGEITGIWPAAYSAPDVLPTRAREFLTQAVTSLHAPAGSILLAASAVDAMLKDKGITGGSLKSRIQTAADTHLITSEMAAWGQEIRLDANDQRHADESAPLPNATDATKVLEFAKALVQFLYVLPARVTRGRSPVGSEQELHK